MMRTATLVLCATLFAMACAATTPQSPPPPTPADLTGSINIDPGQPTALPTPGESVSGGITANPDGVVCRVANGNRVSNVAVRREPNTSAELFYAIQPGYTASVLEVRQVPGSLPWYFVRIDNPIETDLAVVEGWLRSDTVVERSPCP